MPLVRRLQHLACWFLLVCTVAGLCTVAQAQTPRVLQIDVHGTLQNEQARIFADEITRANAEHYDAVLVDLSTPGGMQDAAGRMCDSIRQSRIPVIVWAGKPTTRVAGEGLRLLAEADVALLAPRTFLSPLWTKHPRRVSTQDQAVASEQLLRQLNDAAAKHSRNLAINHDLAYGWQWKDANSALQAGFVDDVAAQPADVFRLVSGRTIPRLNNRLFLDGAQIDYAIKSLPETLLLTLMHPDLNILLLTLGFLLIYLEINTPGVVIPGAAGVLLVLLATYGLFMLPLSMYGVSLCVLAAILLLIEAQFATHGIVALAGIIALILGLGMLVNGPIPQLQVSWTTAICAGLGFGGVTAALIVLGMEARRAKVKTGAEALLGWLAVTQTELDPQGKILVRGELWHARLTSHDSFVAAGEHVKVLRADGMMLEVTAVPVTASV